MKSEFEFFKKYIPNLLGSFFVLTTLILTLDFFKVMIFLNKMSANNFKYSLNGLILLAIIFISTFIDWEKIYQEKEAPFYLLITSFVTILVIHKFFPDYYTLLLN